MFSRRPIPANEIEVIEISDSEDETLLSPQVTIVSYDGENFEETIELDFDPTDLLEVSLESFPNSTQQFVTSSTATHSTKRKNIGGNLADENTAPKGRIVPLRMNCIQTGCRVTAVDKTEFKGHLQTVHGILHYRCLQKNCFKSFFAK